MRKVRPNPGGDSPYVMRDRPNPSGDRPQMGRDRPNPSGSPENEEESPESERRWPANGGGIARIPADSP